jgi:hypothetical protein
MKVLATVADCVLTNRLWDTYLAEGEEFAGFHVYVCAALLAQVRKTQCRPRSWANSSLL